MFLSSVVLNANVIYRGLTWNCCDARPYYIYVSGTALCVMSSYTRIYFTKYMNKVFKIIYVSKQETSIDSVTIYPRFSWNMHSRFFLLETPKVCMPLRCIPTSIRDSSFTFSALFYMWRKILF